jgi:hypothetical protein
MHANICWQIIACIVCKEINLWLRSGWCGLEYGLLLLIVDEVVAAQVVCPSSPCSVPGYLPFSSWVAADPPVLLLLGLVLSFSWTPWFCWICLCDDVQEQVLFLVWCARTVVFLHWCSAGCVSAVSPGDTHQVGCLFC